MNVSLSQISWKVVPQLQACGSKIADSKLAEYLYDNTRPRVNSVQLTTLVGDLQTVCGQVHSRMRILRFFLKWHFKKR